MHRDDGGDGEGKFVAERDVNQNAEQREQRGDDGRALDFLADASAPTFLLAQSASAWPAETSPPALLDFVGRADGRRHAQGFRAVGHVLLILDLRIFFAAGRERGADLLHVQFLREAEGRAVAAKKIHAEQFVAPRENAEAQRDDDEQSTSATNSGLAIFMKLTLALLMRCSMRQRLDPGSGRAGS